MSDCMVKAARRESPRVRRDARKSLGRLSAGFLTTLLVTTALTWPGGPAHAQCVPAGANTVNCTGDLSGGITNQGGTPDFTSPPVTNINVFNIDGNIAPGLGITGIDAQTADANNPLSIFIDIAPFEIITQGDVAYGIYAETDGSNSNITLTNGAAITTHGIAAYGISARTFVSNNTIDLTNHGAITTQGSDVHGIVASTNGSDSTINFTNHGAIATQGRGAYGIIANTLFLSNNSRIDLTNRGAITTQGPSAPGIVAQTFGDNSQITLNSWAPITTHGDNARGIFTSTTFGNSSITVNNWANVIATGPDADGIFAYAQDATSTNTVNLYGGVVQGGSGDGDGIDLTNNFGVTTLNVFAGATVTTLGDNAVEGGPGSETINSAGTVTGSVELAGGTNAFNNMGGGLFNAGPTVDLDGGLLTNAGTFAPGGIGNFQPTTTITGNFTQTGSGILATDLLFGSLTADLTNVSGISVLSGLVVPNIINPGFVQPGTQQVTILNSAGGVTNAGLSLAAADTAVVDYRLLFPGGFSVVLGVTVDFSPSGLNRNQTAVAEAVSATQAAGGSAGFAPVVAALVGIPDLASLADAYDQLGPDAYLGSGITTLFSSLDFTDDLMSCEVREGGNVFIREGQCLWAEATGNWFDQDRTGETVDFDQTAQRIAGGFQAALAPDWRFGMAFGYQRSNLDALNGRQDSEADTLHGGAVLKYLFGDVLLAAAVSGGHGWYDTTRSFNFGGFASQADASHGISHLTGRFRGAYAFTNGVHYLKPLVDLNVSWIGIDGFTESGGGGAALIVDRTDETVLSASPAVEFGWQSQFGNGMLLRPYVRAGVTVFDDPELALTSSFAAAPAGSPGFRTVMGTDDVVGKIAAGLDLLTPDGTVFKAFYEGEFGENTRQQLAGIRASRPF